MKINRKIMIFASMILATAITLPLVAIKGPSRLEVRDTFIDGNSSSEKLVKRANDSIEHEANGEISDIKVQITDESNGKRNIRFVVGIDSTDYTEAGFIITAKGNIINKPISRVYLGIESDEAVKTPQEIFETNKYNYFLAYALIGIPVADYSSSINVKAYIKNPELSLDVLSNELDTSIQEIIDIENPPMQYATLLLDESDPFAGWGANYIKVRWKNDFLYTDLSIEDIFAEVELDGKIYSCNISTSDGVKGFRATIHDGFGQVANPAVSFFKIYTKIIYNNIIYQTTLYARNGKIYTIQICRSEALVELEQYIVFHDYVKTKYEDINWQEFLERKETAISNINTASTFTDVAKALLNAKASLDEVEQRQLNLIVLKEVAISRIDDEIILLKQNWYTIENWTLINSIGRQEIENATNEEEINIALEQAKLNIKTVEKNYNETLKVDFLEETGSTGLSISINNLSYSKMSSPAFASIYCKLILSTGQIYISTGNDGANTYNGGNGTRIVPKQFKLNGTGIDMPRKQQYDYTVELIIEDNINKLYKIKIDVIKGIYDPITWRTNALATLNDYYENNNIVSSIYDSNDWIEIENAKNLAISNLNNVNEKIEIDNIINSLITLIISYDKLDLDELSLERKVSLEKIDTYIKTLIPNYYKNWSDIENSIEDAINEINTSDNIQRIKAIPAEIIGLIQDINPWYRDLDVVEVVTNGIGTFNNNLQFYINSFEPSKVKEGFISFKLLLEVVNPTTNVVLSSSYKQYYIYLDNNTVNGINTTKTANGITLNNGTTFATSATDGNKSGAGWIGTAIDNNFLQGNKTYSGNVRLTLTFETKENELYKWVSKEYDMTQKPFARP